MNTNEYLDTLKEITGSDNKSAKLLEIDKAYISMIRKRRRMTEELAIKIAKIIKIDECKILVDMQIEKSEGEVKKSWVKVKERIAVH